MILAVGVHPLAAQVGSRLDLGGTVDVGGEEERYLRVLQIAGIAPATPWSIQPFSPSQVTHLRAVRGHPWQARYGAAKGSGVTALRLSERVIANSAYPVQVGAGPTWAGRGLTAEVQGGVAASWRGLHLQLAPLAYAAQNASFALAPNGMHGDERFADARFPTEIDAPQRFASSAFARLEPGTSSLTIDAFHLLAGLSSAPQRWGPAREYPLVLGPNGGGFPELYFGTSEPLNLWLVRAHARVVYGRLSQSAYAPAVDGTRTRLGSGLVFTLMPRGIPGLELGASRFIHRPWPVDGVTFDLLKRPFSGGLNIGSVAANSALENQVASVFGRWAFPAAKAEFYGEFYREDFPGRFHETLSLLEKPDDLAAFMLGFQHVLSADASSIRVVRAEIVNGETSHQERGERGFIEPLPPYVHYTLTQGHTAGGFILGSPEAYGGAGWRIGMDHFTTAGRRSVTLERSLHFDWLPTLVRGSAPVHPDASYGLRIESLRFRNGRDYGVTLIPALDLNRNLVAHNDVFNLTVALSMRGW